MHSCIAKSEPLDLPGNALIEKANTGGVGMAGATGDKADPGVLVVAPVGRSGCTLGELELCKHRLFLLGR